MNSDIACIHYYLACGGKPEPRILKEFLHIYPDSALELIEMTFRRLETGNAPEPTDTPEWLDFLQRLRQRTLKRL